MKHASKETMKSALILLGQRLSDTIKQTYRTLGSCTSLPPKHKGQRRQRYSLGRLSPSLPGPSGNGPEAPGKGREQPGGGDEGVDVGGDVGSNGEEGGKGDVPAAGGGGRDIDGLLAASISWRTTLRECCTWTSVESRRVWYHLRQLLKRRQRLFYL